MDKTTAIDSDVISTDAGNGWAGVYQVVDGKLKTSGIPHARARVTGTRLAADIGAQQIADYADFMGQRYGYGDGIWNLTDAPIDLHQNTARRYGGNMHIFLMLVNIARLKIKSGSELTVIVPAPPGLLNEVAPQIKAALRAGESGRNDALWSIQLRTDKSPRIYKIKRVIVVPEGAGAFAAFRYDAEGEPVMLPDGQGGDALSGRVAVMDLGAGTGDVYTVFNGNLTPDAIAHATDDRAGVIHNLLRPILSAVMDAAPGAKHLTTAHIDSYLRRYMASPNAEAATVRISGKDINIEKAILSTCERYAEWVAANKIDPLWASGVDAIVTAGGGWLYIQSWIKQWYANRLILAPDMYTHTKKIALYDLNGVGQLRLAAAIVKAQQV